MMVVQRLASEHPLAVLAPDFGVGRDEFGVDRAGGGDGLESTSRFHDSSHGVVETMGRCDPVGLGLRLGVGHLATGHFLGIEFAGTVRIEGRAIGQREDFAGRRIHHHDTRLDRVQPFAGVREFGFDDLLKVQIHRETDVRAVARGALDAGVVDEFLSASVLFKVAPAILPGEPGVHRAFDAFDAVKAARLRVGLILLVAEESDDVGEHVFRGIHPLEILLEGDPFHPSAPGTGGLQLPVDGGGEFLGDLLFQDDPEMPRLDPLEDVSRVHPEFTGEEIRGGFRIFNQRAVEDDVAQRFVAREAGSLGVEDAAAQRLQFHPLDADGLGFCRIEIVLRDGDVDEPRGQRGE